MINYLSKNNPFGITLILLCFSLSLFAQDNNATLKEISGKVTHLNKPLANVNIIIKSTQKGTKTNTQGDYSIKANVGDIIQYSYVGFNTVSIIVEDVTNILNIEMDAYVSELDEVVLTARKKADKEIDYHEIMDVELKTFNGTINPMKIASAVYYLDNRRLRNMASPSLVDALNGRYSNVRKVGDQLFISGKLAKFDVNGILYESDPGIILNQIEHLYLIKSKALVIIQTKDSFEVLQKEKEEIIEKHKNQNYYKEDAVTVNTETAFTSSTLSSKKNKIVSKDINGTITYLNKPLANVNIIIKGTKKGTKTNTQGNYSIKANVGDVIQYKYMGLKTVTIIVEDITSVLNIEMLKRTNELDEVVVLSKKNKGKVLKLAEKKEKKFNTSMGTYDPVKAGYSITYLDGEDIDPMYNSVSAYIINRAAGVTTNSSGQLIVRGAKSFAESPIWDVDGMVYTSEPPIDIFNIKDVYVIRSLAGANRYGSEGRNGVIVVRTKYGSFDNTQAKQKEIIEQYTNKNYYTNDALAINTETLFTNSYTNTLESFDSTQKAFVYYNQTLKNKIQDYSTHIDIAQNFMTYYNNANVATLILEDLATKYNNNPEVLKAIAYQFQALGLKREIIKLYQNIFKLRPKYAQSYRDLANAYNENELFKKAWRMYMSYLMQGNDVSGEGIGNILYNEMEWLYFNRKNQTAIKERFIPKNETVLDFRNDVRLVFEWNTSEAEFNLEFVNQDKRVYVFEHSLAANQELITDEKEKGYSSKEFFIDDIGEGEWLVNITYKGNKKPEPTYFKVTKYYNWGKAKQTQEITVYKFQNERQKLQLMKLNKQILVASN